MTSSGDRRKLSVVLVPEGGRDTRTFAIPYRTLGLFAGLAAGLALGLTIMAGSWWYSGRARVARR